MAAILTGKDEMFARWAAPRIPHIGTVDNFGKYVAVGVATGTEKSDELLAVVIYHGFFPQYQICQISCAADNPRWASRATIRALLSIPFMQYECNKTYLAIPHTRERVVALVKAIGFTQEAVLKDHFGRGVHAVICRMLTQDYDRIYWRQRQQKKAA